MAFEVAAVFSSNMVLQRRKNIKVFGTADDGDIIEVDFYGEKNRASTRNGKFCVVIPSKEAADNLTMKVSAFKGNMQALLTPYARVEFKNVSVGEVWLCGGQSNMEYELVNCLGGQEAIDNDVPNVRFYYTNKMAYMDDSFYEAERKSSWQEFGPGKSEHWSAIGYFFGKKLAKDLGVTVGLIGCNWGGTSAAAWMSREALVENPETKSYVDEYDEGIVGKSEALQVKEYREYQRYHAEWDKKSGELYQKNPDITWDEVQNILGPCQYPGPKSCASEFRPAGLYKTMLQRIVPYSLKGFIYYQGESDDHRPEAYEKLFSRMIKNWREEWDDNKLPFIFMQLPAHRYKADPDKRNWAVIRQAQQDVYDSVRNTYMAVLYDRGQYNEIHPKEKKEAARRMALLAEYGVYGIIAEKNAVSPMIDGVCSGLGTDSLKIIIKNAEDGLKVNVENKGFEYLTYTAEEVENKLERRITRFENGIRGVEVTIPQGYTTFEVAGSDGAFYPAEARIRGNIIELSSSYVNSIRNARYLYYNYAPVMIFSRTGLPLAPFAKI
ncbi:MAG: sialate O-acetylesterase [Lachnospiraceae bacterium]|nr:sialate O-acetylesterase [Lachnospiraceae bacterium]